MLLDIIKKNQKLIQSLSHPSGCPNSGVHRGGGKRSLAFTARLQSLLQCLDREVEQSLLHV